MLASTISTSELSEVVIILPCNLVFKEASQIIKNLTNVRFRNSFMKITSRFGCSLLLKKIKLAFATLVVH